MMEEAAAKLRGILERMGVGGEVLTHEDEERITLEIQGVDSGLLIGRQGATLDALQYLVNRMTASSEGALHKPIAVDIEGYRSRRAESLLELAHRLADKVKQTGKPVRAQPMSAADRRVIHLALAEVPGVRTRSEGEGSARRLVILPAGESEPTEDEGGGRAAG